MDTIKDVSGPLVTTWPVFTEAMYLVRRTGGWPAQAKLWALQQRRLLEIVDLSGRALERTRALMEKYAEVPMSLADASLVSLAETRNLDQVFTLDQDFAIYRLHGRRPFKLIPRRS